MNRDELSDMEFDALKEVGNVGVGNAATALSKFMDKKIEIDIPDTKFVPLAKLSEDMGGPESVVTSIYLQILGDLKGEAVFLFTKQNAFSLIDLIMGNEVGTTKIMDEMGQSAFLEMSNIFTGAYLTSLSKLLDVKILQSIPHVTVDMAQSIIDFILIKFAEQQADEVLFIKTKIKVEGHDVVGSFFILFDVNSLDKIITSLKEKYGI